MLVRTVKSKVPKKSLIILTSSGYHAVLPTNDCQIMAQLHAGTTNDIYVWQSAVCHAQMAVCLTGLVFSTSSIIFTCANLCEKKPADYVVWLVGFITVQQGHFGQPSIMKVRSLFLLFSIFFAFTQGGIGQDRQFGFYFKSHRTHVRIPFKFQSNLIIVKAQINDRDSAQFIVDTGVSHSIITDASAFQHRPFITSRTIKMAGVGEGNSTLASITIDNSISLGELRVDHHTLVVLNEDVLKLSEYAGMPIHGIIGYELFANLVVSIDFQRQEITFTQPDKYRYRPRKGERYPIYIQDNKAYTDMLSVPNGAQPHPLRVVLDTGAGQALLLDRFGSLSAIPMPRKVVRVSLGRGLTGLINGHLGRLSTVYFGRYALNDVLVSYPDSSDYGLKLTQMPQRQGSVGCELLRRFLVTFNYSAGYIVLKPVKRMMREPFEHDMSGLELRVRGDDFGRFIITEVARNSPAKRAGLQVGDELMVVNHNSANTLTIGTIYRMLQAGEGKPVSMIVRRQSQLITCRFSLKRLI